VAQNSALGYTHSGNLINIGTTSTAQLTSSDSGHSLNISRSNTVNGSSQTLTVTGSVANLQSNCTQTVGTCTDSSNILSLNQQYANATGAVALIQNSGTGNALQIQDGSGNVNALFNNVGNQLTLGRIAASGTVTQGKLVVSDGTTDNFGLTLQATTLTANRTITFPNETGTVCTTGSVCTGYQGALTFNNGLNNTAGTVQLGGTLLQNTAIDAGSSFRLILTSSLNSGARSSYPLVISQANNATNDNSTGLLQLSNSDTGSTAPILNINQVTNGSGISITGLNSGTAIDAGSIDSGTGLDLGSLSSGSGINISGSQLTSGVGLKVNNGVGVTSASAVSVIGSASGSLSSYTGKWLNITPTRTNTATSGTLTDSGNFLNLTRSNTQNGAGGTFAITGALANLQSNCTQTAGTCNDSSNILNLNQQYANASGAVLNIQAAGSGAAINITGQTTSKALVTSTTSGTALDLGSVDTGTAISASGISTGTGLSVLNFISGTGIKLGGANLTTGTGILFNTTSAGITTGSILTATGNASANLASYSGSLINIAPTRTQTGAAVVTDSGSFLKLARANTVNNVAGTFAITGALANLQSNCTQTAGTCTDSSNILNLNQQYASATGAVANIQNAGTGNALQIQDGSSNVNAAFNNLGNQLTLGRVASSGTITQGKLVFADGTTDNFGLTLQATTLTANRTITFPNETGTVCTTGSVCTGYQGALTFNNGLNNTAGTVQLGGSFIQNTTLATGNSFGLSLTSDLSGGARGTYPLSITQANDATNNNTAGLLNLTNSDTGSTGPVLAVSQSANGSAASFVSNGTALLVQGGSSSRAIDITAPGGSGTAVYVNGASAITSGNGISISDAGSGGPAFTGHYINVSPSRTNTATSGTRTDTGNFLNLARSNTQNGAGGTYAITGALANLQSNCTQTAGTCTDTSNILNLNQQYANATGAVALIQNSGTGNALQIQDGSGNVNAAFNNVGNQLTLGRIASSGTVTQGKLVLSDGTTDNFGGTLQTTTLTANRTYTLPDATGTVCIIGSTSCSAAGTGYIQNGTTVQTNANFAIQSAAAGSVGGVIKGATSQTADLFQLQDSTGANLQRVDASGNLETIGYYDNGIGGIGLFGNLLTFSEQFDNAAWTMTNVTAPTADTVVAPDGQTTAESLADSASGGSVSQTSGTAPTNANYTFSLWLKTASGTQNTDLRIDGATSGTGTKVTVPVTTTWQRFSVTQNTNGFTGNIKVDIFPGGTGGSGTVSAWGAQLVLASNPEVYARTTTSTVAASAGVVSNGGLFVSSMNAGDKPLIVQGAPSQSGDLLQLQNSSGTVLSSFASNGNLTVPNVTVASQGTISFVGGTTGQRPGSPTAGQLYFDTSTNQLIQYNGSKWVSDHTTATKIVAASNSSQAEKDAADYVATGSGDQATINTALTAASGGSVYLMEGTYTISAAISIPNNTTLAGADAGTIITLPNAQNGTYNMITNTDTSTGTGVTIQNLKLDGNKANQTSGSMKGIYLQGMGAGSGGSARRGAIIQKIVVQNIYDISGAGINIHGSSNNVVDNVTVMNEDGSGVFVDAFSANNKITGITAQGNGFYGISLIQASNNVVTNNISQGNSRGIDLVTSSGNVISDNNVLSNVAYGIAVSVSSNNNIVDSNVVQSSALQGIRLNSVSNNAITGNSIYDSGGASNNNGILLTGSSSNNISDNFVTDTGCSSNCYAINVSDSATTGTYISDNTYSGDGTHTATINDAGTGTIYANQADASGNLIIKSQGGGLAVGQSSASASLSLQGALVTTQLPTPTLSATVTNVGTSGATTYRYQVTALDGNSGETAGSTVQQTTTGNATLSGTNYNTITWTPVGGAVQYSVYRCTGAACTPLKLTTVSGNVTSYNDQAAGSPSGTAPGSNNTGGGSFGGNVSVQGVTTVSSSGVRVAGQANFASSSGNYSILVSGIQNRVLVIDNASFAGTQIVTNLTNQVVAAVRGAAGQTADLLQLQDSSSNPLSSFSATGQLRVGATYAAMTVPSSLASSPIAGGALTAGAYKYEVTAIDSAGGETTVSNEVTGTTAGGNLTNSLTWTAVTGASGYKVYRTASGGGTGTENYLTTVLTNSYKDTGAITLGSTTPPSTNTAYVSTNVSMSNIQLSIGGNGTPTGQVYVSGTVPASATGTIATAANPYAVSVQGRYAYVVSQNGNKIEVFDVSNPVNPVKTGSVTTSGNVGARSINVQGKYAYVGLESNTVFQILDISNPSNPTSVGTFPSSNNITVNDNQAVYVQGRYAYIVARNGSLSVSNLQIYDISNPVSPVQVSNNMQFGGFGGGIYVKDNIAYVNTVSNGTLYAIDVTNPYSPSQLGSLSALSSNGNGDIYVQGRYAYLNLGNGLSVIDVSNPASMKRVQNVTTAGTARSLTVSGRYAFVTGSTNLLQVFDISNPSGVGSVGSVSTDTNPFNVAVSGRYAYVVNSTSNTLQIFDMGGTYTQQLEAGGAELGALQVDGNAQVVGDTNIQGGLSVGQSIQTAGNLGVSGNAQVQGTLGIVGGIQGGLTINGISTPASPTVTTNGTTGAQTWGYKVVAINAAGGSTPASAQGTTTSGNGVSTLTSSNYQAISWTPVAG
ncbi:MAG TPA: hypothetical protein VLG13_00225, partial [Patescibacteria group bacterium]|nr:hypothetical protein [Patescibacteria group bacterium]